MNDYKNHHDYVVRPNPSMKIKLIGFLLMFFYTALTFGYIFLFWIKLGQWQPLILLPFIIIALINLTWKYVRVEYEFSAEVGVLTISEIYDGRSRRQKLALEVSEIEEAGRCDESARERLSARGLERIRDFSQSPDSAGAWYAVWRDKNNVRQAVIFESDDELLRLLRLWNPSVFSAR